MLTAQPKQLAIGDLLRRPAALLWALFILTMPIYVARGGLPKPADALTFLLVPAALAGWDGRLERGTNRVFRSLLWFTLWVCAVNAAWMAILGASLADALYPVYYLYNMMIFLTALVLFRRYGDAFLRLTFYVVLTAVMLQVATSFFYRGAHFRSSLFFDNPNQLGYYALLAACIISLCQRRLGISVMRTSIALTGCGFLAVISASRSAVSGIAILLIFLVFSNPRVILVASIAAVAMFAAGPMASAIDSMEARVIEKHNPDPFSFFEQRGYDRMVANKEYLVFGAGEQAKSRFADTTRIGRAEIHSSLGTILFSYGILGFVLFGAFIARLVRGAPLRASIVLAAPFLYMLGHQGLRFTTLWVLLAIFLALKTSPKPVPNLPPLKA